MKKILIVDDDKNISELLKIYVQKEGFLTSIANDGKEALDKFNKEQFDLIVLDIMLPIIDGLEVLNEIRKKSNIPIIMLTAKDETFDKVLGLNIGADDYISKPFDCKELMARIKAVLRRNKRESNYFSEVIELENFSINISAYTITVKGKNIKMPVKEIELLFFLASHPNRVFTREELLDKVWGMDYYGDFRTIDVHIKRIREKIEGVSKKWSLKTVWGAGYKFEIG